MMKFVLILYASITICRAGYSDSQASPKDNAVGGAFAGSFSGGGAGGQLAPVPNFDFQNFLNSYFDSLRKYHEDFQYSKSKPVSYSYTYSTPNSFAQAQSSITRSRKRHNKKRLQELNKNAAAGYGFPGGFPAFAFPQGAQTFGGSFPVGQGGPGDGGAFAGASIGPGGIQQTAHVYPENPNSPNINTRFGEGTNPGAGTYSVFTSSVSGASDLDGKKTGFHRATTTVNDNGKVTTYTSSNP